MYLLPPLLPFAPLLLLTVASLALFHPGRRPIALLRWAEAAALGVLALAVAGVAQLIAFGPATIGFGGGFGLIVSRLDALSVTMALLVSFVGWVVVRYSRSYIDGEAREGRFHGLMFATLAAVLTLVQAGSLAVLVLAFVGVGLTLRQLLLFYSERAEAQRAAAKFTLVWGAGDAALILAALVGWVGFGTADIAALSRAASGVLTLLAHIATAL